MEQKHTPGPWAAFTDGMHTNIVAVVPRTDCVFSLPGHDKNEPNVRLIAAAPDLLEALKDLVECINGPEWGDGLTARALKASTAIAKAEGV